MATDKEMRRSRKSLLSLSFRWLSICLLNIIYGSRDGIEKSKHGTRLVASPRQGKLNHTSQSFHSHQCQLKLTFLRFPIQLIFTLTKLLIQTCLKLLKNICLIFETNRTSMDFFFLWILGNKNLCCRKKRLPIV